MVGIRTEVGRARRLSGAKNSRAMICLGGTPSRRRGIIGIRGIIGMSSRCGTIGMSGIFTVGLLAVVVGRMQVGLLLRICLRRAGIGIVARCR